MGQIRHGSATTTQAVTIDAPVTCSELGRLSFSAAGFSFADLFNPDVEVAAILLGPVDR